MALFNGFGPFSNIPSVTKNVIIISALAWLACLVLPSVGLHPIKLLGLHFPGTPDFNLFQPVTYMFLHDTSSIGHLFFNMFAVFMFGSTIESTWGQKRFLTFYIVTGVGAGIVQEIVWLITLNVNPLDILRYPPEAFSDLNELITIGASGAVFGILLAFGMLFPNVSLYIMFIPVPIKAKFVVLGYGLIELLLGISASAHDNVAHWAHLGGMLFGFFLIKYWKTKDQQNGNFYL
jgi:membrane associated rhomboid family serine protease